MPECPIRRRINPMRPVLLTLAALALLAGCRTLPDAGVHAFADSTATLQATLATAGQAAVQDVADLHGDSADSQKTAATLAADLKGQWDRRNRALAALNRYAVSLAGLVDAGKTGQANATTFVDALRALVDTAGVAAPQDAAAVDAVLKGAEVVYGHVARSIAAGEIRRAVEQADPIVAAVADLIAQDLQSLRGIAVASGRTVLTNLKTDSDIGPTFQTYRRKREELTKRALGIDHPEEAADQLTKLTATMAALRNDPDYRDYAARVDAASRATAAQVDLLDQAALTTRAWAAAHHDLVLALRQRRPASVAELTQFTNDLYQIYRDYRAARRAAAAATPATGADKP
jgi:hypothetical protein